MVRKALEVQIPMPSLYGPCWVCDRMFVKYWECVRMGMGKSAKVFESGVAHHRKKFPAHH